MDAANPRQGSARLALPSGSPMQLVDEGVIDMDEALRRVTGAQLAQLMFPTFDIATEVHRSRRDERIAGRCRQQGGLRLAQCGEAGRGGRGGHPYSPRDQPG